MPAHCNTPSAARTSWRRPSMPNTGALLESGSAPCALEPDVASLLARSDVASVVVASPAVAHHEHITLAAAAGKPIFSEKPLADSVPKAEEAAKAVRGAGVPFQIGFQRRYDR